MIKVWTSAGIVTAIIVLSIVFSYMLKKSTGEVSQSVALLMQEIDSESWQAANTVMEEVKSKWGKEEKWLKLFIEHYEIDNINETIIETDEYVKKQAKEDAMANAGKLKHYIQHLYIKEALSLSNII